MPITEELIVEFLQEHDIYTAEDLEFFSDMMTLLIHDAPEAIQ